MVTPNQRFQRILDEGKCIGCGLCASMLPDKLAIEVASTGYLRPVARDGLSEQEADAIYAVCPGIVQAGLPETLVGDDTRVDETWGPVVRIDRGHASDPEARFKAATGGALTALCDYLVASGTAKAILHIKAGGARPSFGTTQVSEDRAGVMLGAGSRYGPSAPLADLVAMLDRGEPFALVAKPCDLSAARLLGHSDPRVGALITHMLTPVCGGFMPPFGMDAFLKRIGVESDEVATLSYRGNGCPGPTRVVLKDGGVIDKTYLDIWGSDASMWHLPWRCKICPDGTGEAADVAAADTWPGGSPTEDMLEGDPGSNAIIARTAAGAKLVADAAEAGFLTLEGPATLDDLSLWQPHQVRKKVASGARYDGLRKAGHLGLETVDLRTEVLRGRLDPEADRQQVAGTVERIAIGKHRDDFGMRS